MPKTAYAADRTRKAAMAADPEEILRALDALEKALEAFRAAYTAWLVSDGEGHREALASALADAEARLDAARGLLADAADGKSYP